MVSWDELKSMLLVRFVLTQDGSLCEKFLALRQEGHVREFRQILRQWRQCCKGSLSMFCKEFSLLG